MTFSADPDGRTPLHNAAHANDADRVRVLIARGVDVSHGDGQGFTALHLAAQEYAVDAARRLIDAGAEIDATDQHGNTPLFVATFNSKGRGEMIGLLRRHGADPDAVNRHGQTPRGLARLIANYEVSRFFDD